MTIHTVSAELVASTHRDDLHRLATRIRVAAACRETARVSPGAWLRGFGGRLHAIGCLPVLGGCDEELIDTRATQVAPVAK